MQFKIIVLVLLFQNPLFSQIEWSKDEKLLKEDFQDFMTNLSEERLSYKDSLQGFISFNKKLDNKSLVMGSYELMSYISDSREDRISYMDSAYTIATELRDLDYIAHFSYKLSDVYFSYNDFVNTLKYASITQSIDIPSTKHYKYFSKFLVALMQFKIEQYNKSLNGFHGIKSYFKENNKEYYLNTIFGITENHLALSNIDSAKYYIDLGHKDPIGDYMDYTPYFSYTQAVYDYKKKHFEQAIDTLDVVIDEFNKVDDASNLGQAYFYRGMAFNRLGKINSSVEDFKKVDSIFSSTKLPVPMFRDAWLNLIEYSKSKRNITDLNYYQSKLRSFDSLNFQDYRNISVTINENLHIPGLLKNKNKELRKQKTIGNSVLITLIVLIIAFCFYIFFRNKREKEKHESYQAIIKRLESPLNDNKKEVTKDNVSEDKYSAIEEKFNEFEKNMQFLDNDITIKSLSQSWGKGFNERYLSKYMNNKKNKRFSDYLNELRIEHVLIAFKENKNQIRNWKSDAVADYLGYNSREYYIKAFKQRTKMTPTEYLKRLAQNI